MIEGWKKGYLYIFQTDKFLKYGNTQQCYLAEMGMDRLLEMETNISGSQLANRS